jgi:hypothetical protein
MSACEICEKPAEVYAMGKYAGDWGGRYCLPHVPAGFIVTDTLTQTRNDTKEIRK